MDLRDIFGRAFNRGEEWTPGEGDNDSGWNGGPRRPSLLRAGACIIRFIALAGWCTPLSYNARVQKSSTKRIPPLSHGRKTCTTFRISVRIYSWKCNNFLTSVKPRFTI